MATTRATTRQATAMIDLMNDEALKPFMDVYWEARGGRKQPEEEKTSKNTKKKTTNAQINNAIIGNNERKSHVPDY